MRNTLTWKMPLNRKIRFTRRRSRSRTRSGSPTSCAEQRCSPWSTRSPPRSCRRRMLRPHRPFHPLPRGCPRLKSDGSESMDESRVIWESKVLPCIIIINIQVDPGVMKGGWVDFTICLLPHVISMVQVMKYHICLPTCVSFTLYQPPCTKAKVISWFDAHDRRFCNILPVGNCSSGIGCCHRMLRLRLDPL